MSWVITQDYLKMVLKRVEPSANLESFTVDEGGSEQQHLSAPLKVTVNINKGSSSVTYLWVVKVDQMGSDAMTKFIRSNNWFKNEVDVYSKLVPAMKAIQEERGICPVMPSIPEFVFGTTGQDVEMVFMKDLSTSGFISWDIKRDMDFEHCKYAMQEFAKLHALGYLLKGNDRFSSQELKTRFPVVTSEKVMTENFMKWYIPFFSKSLNAVVDVAEEMLTEQEVVKRAQKLRDRKLISTWESYCLREEPFATICHGDLKSSNMFFRYDNHENSRGEKNKTPSSICILDWQLTRYAVPATDLTYFLYCSTGRNLRQEKIDELILIYHTAFSHYLKYLNITFPEYGLETLKDHVNRSKTFAIFHALFVLPLVLAKPEDHLELALWQPNSEHAQSMVTNALRKSEALTRVLDLLYDAISTGFL